MAGKARQRAKHVAQQAAHHTTPNAHHTHSHTNNVAKNVTETEEESILKVNLIEDRHPLQEHHDQREYNNCNCENHVINDTTNTNTNNNYSNTCNNVDEQVHVLNLNCTSSHLQKQEEEREEEEEQQVQKHKKPRDGHSFSVRKEKPIFHEQTTTPAALSEGFLKTDFLGDEMWAKEKKWLELNEKYHIKEERHEENEKNNDDEEEGVTDVCANVMPLYNLLDGICDSIYYTLSRFNGKIESLYAFNLSQPSAPQESKFRLTLPYEVDIFSVNAIGTAQILLENALTSLPAEWMDLAQGTITQEWKIKEVRAQFANKLAKTLFRLLTCETFGATRPSSQFISCATKIADISKRAMCDWLECHILPVALRETYCNDTSSFIRSYDDLLQIVHTDAVMWLTTFVPMLETFADIDDTKINLLWMNPNLLDIHKAIKLFHYLHFEAKLQTLLVNKANECRGVLMPKAWLRQFVNWARSCKENISGVRNTTKHHNNDSIIDNDGNNTSTAVIPGPINTFSVVEIMPSYPLKHFIRHNDTEHVDVVPERFYDELVKLFGSGPKYRTFGNFTMKEEVLEALAIAHVNVEVAFCWNKVEENAPTQKRVTVYVEDALVCTDLWEVMRVGLQLVRDEDNFMEENDMERWTAAVVALYNIKCLVKECNEGN